MQNHLCHFERSEKSKVVNRLACNIPLNTLNSAACFSGAFQRLFIAAPNAVKSLGCVDICIRDLFALKDSLILSFRTQ